MVNKIKYLLIALHVLGAFLIALLGPLFYYMVASMYIPEIVVRM